MCCLKDDLNSPSTRIMINRSDVTEISERYAVVAGTSPANPKLELQNVKLFSNKNRQTNKEADISPNKNAPFNSICIDSDESEPNGFVTTTL